MSPRSRQAILLSLTPILVAVLLMLPRLADPHFGFFDDPATLRVAQQVSHGDWGAVLETASGRARPLYWLYPAAVYALAGASPFWSFFGNTVLLALVVAGVVALAHQLGADRWEASLAGGLFVLSGPVIENAYTLSKPELQQLVWILLALLLALWAERSRGTRRVAAVGLAGLAVAAACNTKETAVLLLPISLTWLGLGAALRRFRVAVHARGYLRDPSFLMACVLGLVVYVGQSSLYVNPGLLREGYGSGYQIELEKMLQTARAWVDWLNRDFLYLVPLLVLAVLRVGRLRPRLSEAARWAGWLVLWFALYLPWKFAPEYYLLPFAVGAALLGALLVSVLRQVVVQEKGGWRAAAAAALVLSGLLFVLTLPNNYTNGRLQLAIDSANAEMLDDVLESAPPNAVVLLNHPEGGEYSVHFPSLVTEQGGRSDLTVAVFRSQDPKAEGWEGKTILVVLPVFENQFYPSVRLGVFAHDAARWNEGARAYLGAAARPAFRATQRFRLFNVDAARLFCPAVPQLGYCAVPNTPFDGRLLEYGWEIYFLPPD